MRRAVTLVLALIGVLALVGVAVLACALWAWEQLYPGFLG